MAPSDKGELMIRYLLGESSEEEQTAVEEEYFGDDSTFEELLAVEDELIDAYVRGKLPVHKRERFERHFLTTPQQCQRAEFAKDLMKAVGEARAPVPLPSTTQREGRSWWQTSLDALRGQNLGLQVGLTSAMLAVMIGGSWLLVESLRRRNALEQEEAAQAKLQQQKQEAQQSVGEQPARNDQINMNLQQTQPEQELATRQQPGDGGQTSNRVQRPGELARQQKPRPSIATLVLAPVLVRDPGESNRLIIRPGTKIVRLQANIERGAYQSYRAVLETVEGQEIWSWGGLKVGSTRSGTSVVMSVPANLLSTRNYILALRGVTATGNVEDVREYSFRVMKR